ncbi:hypothetical protein V1264_018012 [Littorina saxatilis]|uniref:Uncharacterized protein n=1 Tax=Littorina saxatilis TaxID=31220 RepID=A0AAN9BKE6_9CAEN
MAEEGSPTGRLAFDTPGSEEPTDRDARARARSILKRKELERKEDLERQTRKEESDRQERQAERDRQDKQERERDKQAEREHQLELAKLQAEKGTPTQTGAPTFVTDRTRLPTFDDDKDELDDFLRRFERIASDQKWEEGTWASRLSICLKGRALQLYNALEDGEARNYQALKKALLQRFNLTAEAHRRRLRNCKRLSGELSHLLLLLRSMLVAVLDPQTSGCQEVRRKAESSIRGTS